MATTYDYKVGTVIALKTDTYYTYSNVNYYAELRITITEIIDDYHFVASIDLYAFASGGGSSSYMTGLRYGYCRGYTNSTDYYFCYSSVTTNSRTYKSGYTFKRNIVATQTVTIINGLYPNINTFKFDASIYYVSAFNCSTTQDIILKKPTTKPIYFNGTAINKVYFNGTEVTGDVYFNGTKMT